MFNRLFLLIIVGITASLSAHAVELGQIASPNGRLTFTLQAADTTDKGSPLTYTIAFDGQILVEPSILNLRLEDRNGTGSPGMNGAETYSDLSGLYDKYTAWVNACYREQMYRTICQTTGTELTDSLKGELMLWMEKRYDFYEDLLSLDEKARILTDIAGEMSGLSGDPAYSGAAAAHAGEWEKELSALEEKLTDPFCYAMLYQVRMPGRLTSANTVLMDEGIPVWKVDGFRLLAGDLTVEATSSRANPLGFILLGLIVIISAVVFFRLRR